MAVPTHAQSPTPNTKLAVLAAQYVRGVEPEFLFNHSVRTYLFGAKAMDSLGVRYNPETAYVAALFHDLGLIKEFSSERKSFEVDSADVAEQFVLANGGSQEQARTIWNAIVMHDMGRSFQSHQSPEARLIGAGAGADVDGPDPKVISDSVVGAVLQQFPRKQFKTEFTKLATDHCQRKPASQIGWLDNLCREVAPVDRGSVKDEISASPFSE